MEKHNKKITLDYEGKKYTLEYDRSSIRAMEVAGFNALDIMRKPLTDISILVEGAFVKHHPEITAEKIWEIYGSLKDKAGFNKALTTMSQGVFMAMIEEPDEKNAVSWSLA